MLCISLIAVFTIAGGLSTSALKAAAADAETQPLAWPAIGSEQRPWAYWWWMGSAVDKTNIARELQRYAKAGLGGVHIIPIYGARGWEDKFIEYLSPKWMDMLDFTVSDARRLGMGVDMTTGTGWCFGGPRVSDADANALVVAKTFEVGPGRRFTERVDPATQALVAFDAEGQPTDLTGLIGAEGTVNWQAGSSGRRVYAVSQRPSGVRVKRAAPGGQGWMLNLIYPSAMRDYLRRFDEAFAHYTGAKPRAMYHDSYEYRSDWAPDFFAEFEKRRGYKLQSELPALFSNRGSKPDSQPAVSDNDHLARVKSDYRETISDIISEESLPLWVNWSHAHGFITRNEAHGSPGNWLDLYADADIPETEMFYQDRSKLISKFASSAAHVAGRGLVSAETGTWLKEHFTETLADMKYLVDDFFLSGINHVIYHGTCYSPDEAGWPGWHFYASYEMNPRNSIWRDVGALNAYVARCQAVLQRGEPDNDILLYWPIYDIWHSPEGMVQPLTIHARNWFDDQPIGKTAQWLWNHGFSFDYVSDRQLASAKAESGSVEMPGATYRAVVVPRTVHMPLATLRNLLRLARAGATVIFEDELPKDVPGWGNLEARRAAFKEQLNPVRLGTGEEAHGGQPGGPRLGSDHALVGELEPALAKTGIARETMFSRPGLMCIRRKDESGYYYFIANRSEETTIREWIPLARRAGSVVVMDPLTGRTGATEARSLPQGGCEVHLGLEPGQSVLLRLLNRPQQIAQEWPSRAPDGPSTELSGNWKVEFTEGGPELPAPYETRSLSSWTTLSDTNAQRFAGTARYTLVFDAPNQAGSAWRLDLGKVCQSARVRLNGHDLGVLFTPPFSVEFSEPLKPSGNALEIEVTNVSANRIRDLDRRGVKWKNFYDINFVNLNYRPFDASNWPLTDSGLLGPVMLTPLKKNPPLQGPGS